MGVSVSDEVRRVVTSSALGHLVTLDPDGTPYCTLAWVGLDQDELVIGTLFDQKKLRNMRGDPRVSVTFATGARNEMGLDEYLVINGLALVEEGGAPELLQHLAETYLGPGIKFPPMP